MERIIVILFDRILVAFLKVIGIVLILSVLVQIFSRIVMVHPFSWTEELSRFSFIWFCFLGSAFTLRKKLHLGIDYFYSKLNPPMQKRLAYFIQGLILAFGAVLMYTGGTMVRLTAIQKSPILLLPMSYVYAVIPLTGFLFAIYSLHRIGLLATGVDREVAQ